MAKTKNGKRVVSVGRRIKRESYTSANAANRAAIAAKLGLSGSPHGTPLIYVVTSEVLAYAKRHDGKVITDRPKLSEHDTWHVAAFTPEEATRLVRERIPQTYQWREPEVKAISVNATIETVRRLPR